MSELSRFQKRRVERQCDRMIASFIGDILGGVEGLVCEHLSRGHDVAMHVNEAGTAVVLRCGTCDADGSVLAATVEKIRCVDVAGMAH